MPIDPKKIEEWARILREVYPLGGMVTGQRERAEQHAVQLASAASALLAERDEILAEREQRNRHALESDATIEKLKGTVGRLLAERDEAAKLAGLPGWRVEQIEKDLRRLRNAETMNEQMLALLREVEWGTVEYGYPRDCLFCHEPNELGHAPDCRLAAFLRTA